MKPAAALIVRNAEETIERCIRSVRRHVVGVWIYLAGESTDGTVDVLTRLQREPGPPLVFEQGEWRDDFAWAREQSFAMVPRSRRWIVWLDADDELIGGEQAPVAVALAERHGLPLVLVDHAYHWLDGTQRYAPRERIVDRTRGKWRGIVHEMFQPERPDLRVLTIPAAEMHVRHQAPAAANADGIAFYGKPPGHYLPLILKATRDVSRTPRAFYYLAREYASLGLWDEALPPILRYLSERHDRIEGRDDLNSIRHEALRLGVEIAEGAGDPAVAGWLRGEHADYTRRIDQHMAALQRPVGRNEPCPCGSGAKFKRCCAAGAKVFGK